MFERIAAMYRSPEAQKIVGNFGWLLGQRGISLVVSLVVSVFVARYLGPDRFGMLSYAVAFVGLFGTFVYLGISGIAVRDLVEAPADRDEILGTAFALKLGGALVALLVIVGVTLVYIEDTYTRHLIWIVSIGMVFQAVTVVEFWYKSRVEDKHIVVPAIVSSVVAGAIKLVLIVLTAPLVAFVVVVVAQQAMNMLGLLYVYRSQGLPLRSWRFRSARARSLLRQSWPLILSSVGAIIYLKIDQVMLGHYADDVEVGLYAIAARLSELWYFVPTALAGSLFPKIVKLKTLSHEAYMAQMQRIYRIMVLMALAIAVAVTVAARPGIVLLYGEQYRGAATVLMLHIWACPAVFMAAVLSKWLISEGLLIFSLTRHGFGAVANIAANVYLIPRYGAVGAAVATVLSYTVASYLACFTDRRTFHTGVMMTRALLLPFKGVLRRPESQD